MAITSADQELQQGIESGSMDPIELEQMVRDTNMAEPAKQSLIEKIRAVKPAGADPYQAPPTEPERSTFQVDPSLLRPVSPLASAEQRSFFLDTSVGTDYFDIAVASKPQKPPLPEVKAREMAFATAVLTGQDKDDMEGIAEQVSTELSTVGSSTLLAQYEQTREEEDRAAVWQGHWTNKNFLEFATQEPQIAGEILAEAELELADLRTMEKRARLVTEAVQRLSPKQKTVFNDFKFVMEEVLYQQTVDQVMSRKMAEDTSNASLWDWAVVLVSPFTAVTSRSDQSKLMGKIADVIGSDPKNYVFKAEHGRVVTDYLLDPSITVAEARSRLSEVQAIMEDMDYEQLGVNPLHAAELYEVINSQLQDKNSEMTMGNLFDAVDAAVLTGEVVSTASLLKRAGDALSVRLFGQLGGASNKMTEQDIEALVKHIEEVAKPVQVNTPAGQLLTQAPTAVPTGASKREQEVRAKIETLRTSAEGAPTRLARKELEAQKKTLGSKISDVKAKDTKEQTRVYQAEGLKQKDAKKRAEAEKKQEILNLEAEMERLQADIDLVDSMAANKSELSRLEQELQSLTSVEIPKTKLSQSISTALTSRGSTLDALVAQNAVVARSVVSHAVKNDPDALQNLGVTAENVAERIIPTPNSGLGFHHAVITGASSTTERLVRKFQTALDDLQTSDLLTNEELKEVPDKWAQSITSASNGTMFSTHSSLVRVEETGEMVVRGVFGGSVDGGYDNLNKAERALQTLFDGQGRIKVRPLGSSQPLKYLDELPVNPAFVGPNSPMEYFIEAENSLRPNASFANPFEHNYISPVIPGASYLQSWSKLIQKDLMDQISAYVDKSTRIASIQREMLAPVLKMGSKDKEVWTKLLMHGDENEMVFSSPAEASRVLNIQITPKAWEAYAGTRAYYNSVADVRQRSVYKHLDQNGYKTVYGKGGVLSDLNGQIHVRPFVEAPSIGTRPADNTDELFRPTQVWGKEIWDLTTGEAVKLTDEVIKKAYIDGNIIARVSREAEFRKGQAYNFVIVKPDSVRPLSKRPMNIRQGHVDLNYRPQDSWFAGKLGGNKGGTTYKLREVSVKRVDGEDVIRETTIGLYANLQQAIRANDQMINDAIQMFGPDPTPDDLQAVLDKYPTPVLTREGEGEFGIDMAGTLSGVPAHARKRGEERLLGPSGIAEILDLEESLTRSIGEVRRNLGIDAVEVQKRRFGQTYAKHMQGYNGFESDFSRFTWKEEAKAAGLHKEAERAHAWISNIDHAVSNREFTLFMHHVESYALELMNSSKKWKQEFGEILRDVSQNQLDTELKKLTATLLIGTRVLYQSLANTAQAVNLFIHDPLVFGKDTLRRTFASMIGLAALKIDSRVLEVVGSVMSGMTPQQFKTHVQNMKNSGIVRSAASADIAALLGEAGKIEAGRHNLASGVFWKRLVPGLGGMERVGKALMFTQHVATDIANLFAYNHAMSVQAKKVGIDAAVSRRGAVVTAGDTRRLTFNQNRMDQFAYQQNAASIQMMFFQHVHRMYNDLIIDPMVRLASLNKASISKDGTNLYAQSYASSLKTFALMSSLWGASVYPVVDYAKDGVSDYMESKGYSKEVLDLFFDGLIAKGVEDAFGSDFNIQSRLTPAGALQTTFDMMFTNDGGLVLGGPVTHLGTVLSKLAHIAEAYWNTDGMDKTEWSKLAVAVASSATSGTNDVYRAMIAANMLEYVDSSGRPLVQVQDMGWLPILFSIPPDAVDTVYDTRTVPAEREKLAREIASLANRTAMAEYGGMAEPSQQDVINATRLGLKACELMSGSDKILAQITKENFLKFQVFQSNGILVNHADKLIGILESDKAVQEIEKLMEADPNNKEVYKFLIESLKDNGNVQ